MFDILDIKLNKRNVKLLKPLFKGDLPDHVQKLYDEKLYTSDKELSIAQNRMLNHIYASDYVSKICIRSFNDNYEKFVDILDVILDQEPGTKIVIDKNYPISLYELVKNKFKVSTNSELTEDVTIFEKEDLITYNNGPVVLVTQSMDVVADRIILLKDYYYKEMDAGFCDENGIHVYEG